MLSIQETLGHLAASFWKKTIPSAGTTIDVRVALYSNTSGDNIFTEIPGSAIILFPCLTGVLPIGSTSQGTIDGLSIPVTAGTRIVPVVSITASGLNLITTVQGDVSVGVGLD